MRKTFAVVALVSLLSVSCVDSPPPTPAQIQSSTGGAVPISIVPPMSHLATSVLTAGSDGQPTAAGGILFDPVSGWTAITPGTPGLAGGLYIGSMPEGGPTAIDGNSEGAIVVTGPTEATATAPGTLGALGIYKRMTLGYGLSHSPTMAHVAIADFEVPGDDDATGSAWRNGLLSFETLNGAGRFSMPRISELNLTMGCGGKLTLGAQEGSVGQTCYQARNDVEIGQDHRLTAHTGIALDPAVMPSIEGALSQVQDPAAREVLRSIIAALSSQQLHVAADKTQ